jgi:lysine-N-methylase
VTVDREHHDRLRGKMSSPEERDEFNAKVRRIEGKTPVHKYALMVLREDRTCSFLSGDRLCTIHGRYGEELLPDTCASYPRSPVRIGDRLELTATPSCPEVARLVLTSDDGLDLVSYEPPETPLRFVLLTIDPVSKDPYEANFVPVRGLVASLLKQERFPVASRLFFVAFLADKGRDILKRGQKRFDAEALQELGTSLEDPTNLATLHRTFGRALVDPKFGLSVVREMLGLPARLMPAALAELVAELNAALAPHGASIASDPIELQRVLPRLPPLAPELAARLDVLGLRYALHEILRTGFAKEPTFIAFFHRLLLRLASFRFLVGTLARTRSVTSVGDLDALATRAVYLLTRALDHNAALMQETLKALEAHGLLLEHAVSLIRV